MSPTSGHPDRVAWWRARRLLWLLLGCLLMVLGAMFVGVNSPLIHLAIGGDPVFGGVHQSDSRLEAALPPSCTGFAEVQARPTRVDVEVSVVLPRDHLLVALVAAESTGIEKELANRIAWVQVRSGVRRIAPEWSTVSVSLGVEADAEISVAGSVVDPGDEFGVGISRGGCPVLTFELAASELKIIGAQPQAAVVSQSDERVSGEIGDEEGSEWGWVEVALSPKAASGTPAVPPELRDLLTQLALLLWPLVPWLVLRNGLWRQLVRPAPRDEAPVNPLRSLYLLVGLGLVGVVAASIPTLEFLTFRWPLWLSNGAPAVAGAFAAWAYVGVYGDFGRPRRWVRLPLVGAASGALLLAGLALLPAVSLTYSNQSETDPQLAFWFMVGVIVAVGGAAMFATGLAPLRKGWLETFLVAATVVLAVAILESLPTGPATNLAVLLVLGCQVALLASVFWVSATGTSHPRPPRWWAAGWPRWVSLGLALVIVIPLDVDVFGSRAFTSIRAQALGVSLRPWLTLGLLAVGVGLIWWLSSRTLSRRVAIALTAALILRPDIQYLGIPWSLLVGWGLISWVLLPRRQLEAGLRPEGGQNSAAVIGRFFTNSGVHRPEKTAGTSQPAIDAESGSSEADSPASPKAVPNSPMLSPEERRVAAVDGLSWAGQADPWKRALLGALVAGLIGACLQLLNLAQGLGEFTNLAGLTSWSVVTTLLVTFRYPFYGLVFGFLYPLIPGLTGFAKSLRLFAVLAGSEVVVLLIPYEEATDTVGSVVLRLLQVAMVSLALGVGGDLLVLHRLDIGPAGLRVLYRTNAVILWSSTALLTAVTAVATAALGSAATLIVERVIPESPPTVPVEGGTGAEGEEPTTGS